MIHLEIVQNCFTLDYDTCFTRIHNLKYIWSILYDFKIQKDSLERNLTISINFEHVRKIIN